MTDNEDTPRIVVSAAEYDELARILSEPPQVVEEMIALAGRVRTRRQKEQE